MVGNIHNSKKEAEKYFNIYHRKLYQLKIANVKTLKINRLVLTVNSCAKETIGVNRNNGHRGNRH